MDTAIVDIESSSLEAVGAGFILCAVVKPLGKPGKVIRYDELGCRPAQEKKLIKVLLAELNKYDIVVGHNIRRFDWNFIKSRATLFGVPIIKYPLVYDTLDAFRRCGFLTRQNVYGKPTASLAFIADFLDIKQEKTAIYPRAHWKGIWEKGEDRKAALDNLVDHCVRDCRMNEVIFRRLFEQDSGVIMRRLR